MTSAVRVSAAAHAAGERHGARPARADLRLLPVAVVSWCVASAAILLPQHAWPIAALCAGGCAAAAVAAARTRPRGTEVPRPRTVRRLGAWWPVVAVACGIGAAVAAHVALAQPSRAAAGEYDGRVEVTGVVETKVDTGRNGLRFVLRTTTIDAPGRAPLLAGVPVQVLLPPEAVSEGTLDLGSRVVVAGGARPTSPGDAAALLVFGQQAVVERDPPHVFGAVSFLRDAFAERAAMLPGPGGELLPGLAVGDTRAVSAELDEAMRVTSLAHLTAVSGANCGIVVGVAFAVCALFGAPRAVRVVTALVSLVGFVLLVTPDASVIRAATMSAIAMLALLLGRTGAGVAVLSLAVAVLVALDPWRAFDFGFLLSVSATGALLLLAGPLARGLERHMPAPLALAISVPLSAQLACGPIIVLFAPEVQVYGVLANLIAVPANPIVTVTGLIACLLVAFPPLGVPAAWIAWLPSAWIGASAEQFAALPSARLDWWEGWPGFLALVATGACVALLIVIPPARRTARMLRIVAGGALSVLLGAAVGGSAATSAIAGPLTSPRDWAVAACDVGQGDAVLIRSGDAVALVDTGPDPEPLASCLSRLGIAHVDLLVITHFDLDHTGGVAALRDRVGHVIHGPDGERGDAVWAQLGDPARTEVSAGDRGPLGDAGWHVLWPTQEQRRFEPGNDTSVVLEVSGGGVPRSLLLGDLGEESQAAMLRHAPLTGPYEIVKVAHHGSADQLDRLYVEAAGAVALVTVGENGYGHPRDEILSLVEREGASVARTDVSGLVLVAVTPHGLSVWRERGG